MIRSNEANPSVLQRLGFNCLANTRQRSGGSTNRKSSTLIGHRITVKARMHLSAAISLAP